MKKLATTAAVAGLLAGVTAPTVAVAEEVTLKSTDGTINLTAEFKDFVDDTYIVRTALGELRIAAASIICEGAACPTFNTVAADVTIAGSDAMGLAMMPLLMNGYATTKGADAEISNPTETMTLATLIGDGGFGDEIGAYSIMATDNDHAFAALLDGSATVGMSSRRITRDEARALRAVGSESMVSPSQEHIVAVDSMVIVTHPSNPVSEISVDQLRQIFAGEISNWSQLGGNDKPINVISYQDGSANKSYFFDYLYGETAPNFLPQGIAGNDQDVANVLFHDQNAIGYVGYAFQRGAKPLTVVSECGIASLPDDFSAKTEEYTLARRLYLYNRSDTVDAETQEFLTFATSAQADGLIGKSGFIDLGIVQRTQGPGDPRRSALFSAVSQYDVGFEGQVMNEMLDTMGDFDRLSTTFRFRTGSSDIDERGQLDMQRLITFLERAPAGTEVLFVGFTDDVGAFDANQRLAQDRAGSVLEQFRQAAAGRVDHVELGAKGYGEVAPAACNTDDRGRGINRRVEVWISNTI